jgi:uncharacterized protein
VGPMTTFEIVCDGDKMVLLRQDATRLLAYRAGYESLGQDIAMAENQKPELPAGVQELERQVRVADGTTLACSLVLPTERRGLLPSAIFLNGTGPQDRDGDSPGGRPIAVALFRHLAIGLAQRDVASLRCDDRGVGGSQGTLATATLDSLVADASAQVAQLRSEPGLDPARVAVVGHSEGGAIGPLVASRDGRVRALVLLAAMGRPLDQISLDQREAALKASGMSEADRARDQKRFARIYAAIRAGKPLPAETTDSERQALEPILGYLASHLRHDPQKTLRAIKVPVLVARGGKDFHVSERDLRAITEALRKGGNRRVTVKTYPELSHVFAPTRTGTIEDYRDPSLTVDPTFVSDVAAFLAGAL